MITPVPQIDDLGESCISEIRSDRLTDPYRAYSSQRISRDPNRITSGSPDDASYNEVPLVAASSSAGSRSSNVANQPMHVSTQSPGLSQATSTSPSRYYAADSLQMDQESGSLTFLGPTAIPRQRADIPGHSPRECMIKAYAQFNVLQT